MNVVTNAMRYLRSFMSCKDYTERASRSMEANLPVHDKVAFGFHHVICMMCRRFFRQVKLIDRKGREFNRCCEHMDFLGGERLSMERREQIRHKLTH